MTHINELVIRIPGMNAEDGRRLGYEVGQLIAEALPETKKDYELPELKIRIQDSQLGSSTSLASSIARQVIMQIKLATLYT